MRPYIAESFDLCLAMLHGTAHTQPLSAGLAGMESAYRHSPLQVLAL